MIGLTSLKLYNSIFNSTEENIKFEHYIFSDSKKGGITYGKVKDEIEEDLDFLDTIATDIQGETIGPMTFEDYRKEVSKRMKNDKYLAILAKVILVLIFKNSQVISEQKLICLKMIIDWF